MPIIITLHIFGYTVTVRIKKQNRHSDMIPIEYTQEKNKSRVYCMGVILCTNKSFQQKSR